MPQSLKADNIKYLVVHCSDTPNFKHYSVKEIDQWHRDRGWEGIGYHAVISPTGKIWGGRLEIWQGAHVREHNFQSLGVCLIGTDQFSIPQMTSLKNWLVTMLGHFPDAIIVGHNDLDNKKPCPNFDVKAWADKNIYGISGR